MKEKCFLTALLVTGLFFSSGCHKNHSGSENAEKELGVYEYEVQEVVSFAADEEQSVYVSLRGKSEIQKLDTAGEVLETYDFGEGEHCCLYLYDGGLFSFTYGEAGMQINECDLASGVVTIHSLENIDNVYSMCVTEDAFYLIVWNETYEDIQEKYDDYDDYFYMGEHAIRISRKDNMVEDLQLPYVIEMTAKDGDTLVYYAYDAEGGYYFIEYDCRENSFGEKVYNNQFGYTYSFAVNGDTDQMIYNDAYDLTLVCSDMAEGSVRAEFGADTFALTGNDIQIAGENCYVLNGLTEKLVRYNLNCVVMKNDPIVCYSPELYKTEPYGCGYQIENVILKDDEFALSVLAGDGDYDICMMHSASSFSRSIRDQGAFYPLNDVPGVQEYLDSCHDYIQEAATDADGSIWMIPVLIEVPHFLYQNENCQEQGILFKDVKTYQDIFALADAAFSLKDGSDWYEITGYNKIMLLEQYNANYGIVDGEANYDTDLFRTLCEDLKAMDLESEQYRNWMIEESATESLEEYYGHYLFKFKRYNEYSKLDIVFDSLNASPIPQLAERDAMPTVVSCMYFSVNQNSKNLSSTLDFISSYCDYMMNRNDTCMNREQSKWFFPDSQLTTDLYNICANGTVYFELPGDIFWDVCLAYFDGEMTLDEFISETERKVNMYLKE